MSHNVDATDIGTGSVVILGVLSVDSLFVLVGISRLVFFCNSSSIALALIIPTGIFTVPPDPGRSSDSGRFS